ncbi:hypothetical protein H1P_3150006 [Hyella patelloides LEGE 07179]|uniref:Uncharacterized protein n=1 Tax=Hyella patelloides LEGE 07179 TaxID=945734 RepID=A0A563VUX7_9CYAN|nr:hypothetical protein H1P_3150006 [Hyella patelloides LEGE 07179]
MEYFLTVIIYGVADLRDETNNNIDCTFALIVSASIETGQTHLNFKS